MSFAQKKDLVSFGMAGDDVDSLEEAVRKYILRTAPSILADAYRQSDRKQKAIQALQHKLTSRSKRTYIHEILASYVYFGDYDGAMQRIASLNFRDEPVERLELQIFIHQTTQSEKVLCGSSASREISRRVLGYLSRHFNIDVFCHFRKTLGDFCSNNKRCSDKACGEADLRTFKSYCTRKYLQGLGLESLRYIYCEMGVLDALRIMVLRSPKVGEQYLREFSRKCLPTNEEGRSILERVYSPALFALMHRRSALTRSAATLKKLHARDSDAESKVRFESAYCKRVGGKKRRRYVWVLYK